MIAKNQNRRSLWTDTTLTRADYLGLVVVAPQRLVGGTVPGVFETKGRRGVRYVCSLSKRKQTRERLGARS